MTGNDIEPKDRILVSIDTPDLGVAIGLAERVGAEAGGIKLGMEFHNAQGAEGVRAVAGTRPLFLDLQYHDTPNTVAGPEIGRASGRERWGQYVEFSGVAGALKKKKPTN